MTQEGMQGVAKAYFDKLFSSSNTNYGPVLKCVKHRLFEDDNCELNILDEFIQAFFNMNLNKAPGLDSFNLSFYKRFWSMYGEELFQACVSWI